jgi:hypothetical protein
MQYEVRYLIGGEERSDIVEAETAADAARIVQDQFLRSESVFELIQVQLLDDQPLSDSLESGTHSR